MILLLFEVCCYRPLLKVYETSQLGLIALHIFRIWHGTIRCNRRGSEPLLLVDCCVLCSVITVLTVFIARLSVGTAFIARLLFCFPHSVLCLSQYGVHRSSLFDWILRSSLDPFRFRLGVLALFAHALVDVVIS